jgi:glycosyltransferase involved in cell wall biosynthesis
MIIGTDPILSPLVILPWRLFHRKIKIFHWCFDVYPDAAIADGLLRERSCTTRLLRRLLRSAYRQCDQVADLGSCMRKLLNDQGVDCPMQTITPWALVEPEIIPSRYSSAREGLFGSAQLTLLYSGTLGRAHSYDLYLQLVEHLATDSIAFCFAGQGARIPEIMARAAQAGSTILLAGFTEESQLPDRLAAGDVHLVSLSENWTGLVVPSKFFAALAMGRPVLFLGSERSAVARWIAEHKVGWTLHAGNLEYVAHALREVQTDAARWDALSQRCHQIYHAHFSRRIMRDRWLTVLQSQTRH